jgi:hypothetical protein
MSCRHLPPVVSFFGRIICVPSLSAARSGDRELVEISNPQTTVPLNWRTTPYVVEIKETLDS